MKTQISVIRFDYKRGQKLYFKMNLWKNKCILIRGGSLIYQVKVKVNTKY